MYLDELMYWQSGFHFKTNLNRSKQRNDDGFVNNENVNNKIATWQRNKNYSTVFLEGINSADASHKKGGSKKSHSCSSKTKRGKSLSLRSSLRQNSYQSSITSSSSESEHEEIQSTKGMLKANYMPNRVFETWECSYKYINEVSFSF